MTRVREEKENNTVRTSKLTIQQTYFASTHYVEKEKQSRHTMLTQRKIAINKCMYGYCLCSSTLYNTDMRELSTSTITTGTWPYAATTHHTNCTVWTRTALQSHAWKACTQRTTRGVQKTKNRFIFGFKNRTVHKFDIRSDNFLTETACSP